MLRFEPGPVQPGRYRFEIRTAGSAALLLHAAWLPLAFSGEESRLDIRGGTRVPWSPLLSLSRTPMGAVAPADRPPGAPGTQARRVLPAGRRRDAGHDRASGRTLPLRCTAPGGLKDLSACSRRPAICREHIAERQKKPRSSGLEELRHRAARRDAAKPARAGQGAFVVLAAERENGAGCYSSLGAIGKPAEKVADEAAKALAAYVQNEAVMDEYLADQILLPLSLIPRESEYTTCCVTAHLITNAEIIRRFVPADIRIEGEPGKSGRVIVTGCDPRHGARVS